MPRVTPERGVDLGWGRVNARALRLGVCLWGAPLRVDCQGEAWGDTAGGHWAGVAPGRSVCPLDHQPCPNSQPGPAQPANLPVLKMPLISNLGKSTVDLSAFFPRAQQCPVEAK